MTSWERSRFIPWTHLNNVSAPEYESSKEHVYRSLNREASKEKEASTHKISGGADEFVPPEVLSKKKGLLKGVEYNTPDLLRAVAFGGCIGSITGAVFGFMDGMRTAGESTILKNASNICPICRSTYKIRFFITIKLIKYNTLIYDQRVS